MNYINYLEKKAIGAAVMNKVGTEYAVSYSRYDQHTGVQLESVIENFKRNELVKAKQMLNAEKDKIDLVLADVDALG